jgi:hypothetical protein
MSRSPHIRGDLHSTKLIQPEFGARHAISYTEEIDDFFHEMNTQLTEIVTTEPTLRLVPELSNDASEGKLDIDALEAEVDYLLSDDRDIEEPLTTAPTRQKRLFRVYDDPKRVGISVLERRLPRAYAQRNRVKWTRNDVGRIQGEIKNELARMELAGRPLEATFTGAVRLGDADENKARKIGLILDQENEISEFITREHEIVIDVLKLHSSLDSRPYQ